MPQLRRLVVTNTGQRPVHISFIPKLNDTALTKDWLVVKPTSAVIHPCTYVYMHVPLTCTCHALTCVHTYMQGFFQDYLFFWGGGKTLDTHF